MRVVLILFYTVLVPVWTRAPGESSRCARFQTALHSSASFSLFRTRARTRARADEDDVIVVETRDPALRRPQHVARQPSELDEDVAIRS
jgi:hypothetical protein